VISQEWGKDLEVFMNTRISTRFAEHIIRTGHATFEIQLLVWDMRNNMAGLKRVSLAEQEMPTLPEHLCSLPVFGGIVLPDV
jgi:hypothetical protein